MNTTPTAPSGWQRLPMVMRVGIVLTGLFLLIGLISGGLPGLLITAGIAGFGTAMYSLGTTRKSWLMIPSQAAGLVLLVAAIVVSGIGVGSTVAAQSANLSLPSPDNRTPQSAAPDVQKSSSPTPSPSPAASVTKKKETETQEVPFETTTIDDGTLTAGTTAVTTTGVPGVRTIVYEITLKNGVEVARKVVSDTVTTPPITQVVANGTYVAPPAPVPFVAEPPAAGGGCDPNYDPCVPIASDVDCEGGSGNGPAYVRGPVYVIGSDPYDLDRDGDGIACD